ncbi:response regulator [Chryseobacterium sp. Ch-15]|uniref:Response regulator n=1 Tax=Chryseobacterium muglaense TaxID=2893752 RepID=A0A9Q3V140_9FLAO|nr:response regulator [Chryseobacterium muglaense]MBD3905943.1 response regulator [Chryseobacterium muglaense]MCC9035027.1 response regulator [Chryseobacterium muglaense]MCC9037049.1 response regulator [Chryseobacterium muglaense]MCM2555740.1 response regulator [Chryseobacterium muglaense]
MKLILIEDDQHKAKQIIQFMSESFTEASIELKKSYQSGLKELLTHNFDLVLLDMQLPNFDIKPGEDGYKFRKLAGIDIMRELTRKRKNCKIIVITQFETFGEGEFYIDLANLKQMLKSEFSAMYIDTIFYSPDNSLWQKELLELIQNKISC